MWRLTCCRRALPAQKAAFMELVKALRSRTEAPITDCTAALKEADGDMTRAVQLLQQKGSARALKKGHRVTEHGALVGYVGATPQLGAAVITVCTETDFAARSDPFLRLCDRVAAEMQAVVRRKAGDGQALLVREDNHASVAAEMTAALSEASAPLLRDTIAVLGENVRLRSVAMLPLVPPQCTAGEAAALIAATKIGVYVHGDLVKAPVAEGAGVPLVGRFVGLVALRPRRQREQRVREKAIAVPQDTADAVARHFVANSGAEDGEAAAGGPCDAYLRQPFFGTQPEETLARWLKRHGVEFGSSLVVEFAQDPVIHVAHTPRKEAQAQDGK